MLVKVIKDFNDRTADLVTRVVDDEFDVTEQRAEDLIKRDIYIIKNHKQIGAVPENS